MDKKSDFNIDAIANLARLDIDACAKEKIRADMADIVGYIEELAELKLDNLQPMDHSSDVKNVFREDVATPSLDRETMLANAPETLDGELVKVPAVLPEDEE